MGYKILPEPFKKDTTGKIEGWDPAKLAIKSREIGAREKAQKFTETEALWQKPGMIRREASAWGKVFWMILLGIGAIILFAGGTSALGVLAEMPWYLWAGGIFLIIIIWRLRS